LIKAISSADDFFTRRAGETEDLFMIKYVGTRQRNGKYHSEIKHRSLRTMRNERIFKMAVSSVYPLYIQKVERKGRTKEEVDTVICWMTGYDERALRKQIEKDVDFETFFAEAPQINPNTEKITGVVCGVRVEEVENPLMQKIRWLDKLIDELAKGKPMEKVLRG
jgi:hypothetical protein